MAHGQSAAVLSTDITNHKCTTCSGPTRRRTLRWPIWPTGRTGAILDIEIRPVKDRSQESSCLDAVPTAGWWFQQAAQRLRAVSNRGPQAARRGFGDGPGLAEAVV
jgi:hypothetical protein